MSTKNIYTKYKSNAFLITKKDDNYDELNNLINNREKFTKLPTDLSNILKNDIKNIFTRVNRENNSNLIKISDHYEPSYLYGNPKTHKNKENPPLRRIASHLGTVTYKTANLLNETIFKYLDKKYMVNSTYELISLSQTIKNPKLIASLDIESLFTNVSVLDTIKIISDSAYNHPDIAAPGMRDAI